MSSDDDVLNKFIPREANRGQPQTAGAYAIKHTETGKIYAGSASNVQRRTGGHLVELKKGTHPSAELQSAFTKNPSVEITLLPTSTRDEAYDIEQNVLDTHLKNGLLFNQNPDARGKTVLRSTIEKMREANLGKTNSPETIQKRVNSLKGYTHSEEAKEKMRSSSVGKNLGHVQSQETKSKISETLTGRTVSEETRIKLRAIALQRAQQVSIDGIVYDSASSAAQTLNITEGTLRWRLTSNNHPTYFYM